MTLFQLPAILLGFLPQKNIVFASFDFLTIILSPFQLITVVLMLAKHISSATQLDKIVLKEIRFFFRFFHVIFLPNKRGKTTHY